MARDNICNHYFSTWMSIIHLPFWTFLQAEQSFWFFCLFSQQFLTRSLCFQQSDISKGNDCSLDVLLAYEYIDFFCHFFKNVGESNKWNDIDRTFEGTLIISGERFRRWKSNLVKSLSSGIVFQLTLPMLVFSLSCQLYFPLSGYLKSLKMQK